METNEKISIEQLLANMEQEMGRKPLTMELLAQINEEAVFNHQASKKFAMSGKHIPAKYKMLINLAVSVATGSVSCAKNFTNAALKNGATKEEIVESILLARFVKSTSVISGSTEIFEMLLKKE